MLHYLYLWVSTHLPKSEKGQDMAEYALLLALIALVVITAIGLFRDEIVAVFNDVVEELAASRGG